MAVTCGFSNGFSSGFSICVDVVDAEVLRGVPPLPGRFRRLRPVELDGFGIISIIGTADLAVLTLVLELEGSGAIVVEASADLSQLRQLAANGGISVIGQAQSSVEAGLGALLPLVLESTAVRQQGVALAATSDLAIEAIKAALTAGAALVASAVLESVATGILDVVPAPIVTVGITHELAAAAIIAAPIASASLIAHRSLTGAGEVVVHSSGDVDVDDERTVVLLLLGLPDA